MTPLRRKRLLLLATSSNCWHKAFYHLYYPLIKEGLVHWTIGSASLTDEGVLELNKLLTGATSK